MTRADKCEVCGERTGLVWHHLYYTATDVRYTDFPATPKGRREYVEAVDVVARADRRRFAQLCKKHHFVVERFAQFHPATLDKVVRIARKTRRLQDEVAGRQAQTRGTRGTRGTRTARTARTADELAAQRKALEADIARIERKLEISKLERRVAVLT